MSLARTAEASLSPTQPRTRKCLQFSEQAVVVEQGPNLQEAFKSLGSKLDERNDRRERIFKSSRDVTVQSKRAITALHRGCLEDNRAAMLQEMEIKLKGISGLLAPIASELISPDDVQFYSRSYSPGIQEYIEALSFFWYLKTGTLLSKANATSFIRPACEGTMLSISNEDYVLGLADLSGELMRLGISAVGRGQAKQLQSVLHFLRNLVAVFLDLPVGNIKGLNKKLEVMVESLAKVERAAYTLKLREGELPSSLLTHLCAGEDEDS